MTRVFVPRDAAAIALGANAVAAALTPHATVVRTGSRGMFWLEPMIEVETPTGRIAYGPIAAADVPGLLVAGALTGGAHPLRLGAPNAIPFLARQTRSDTATANARRMKSRHSVMTLMSDQVLLSCSVMSQLASATALPVSAWRHSSH